MTVVCNNYFDASYVVATNAVPATRFLPEPANRPTVSNFVLRKTDTEHVRSVFHLQLHIVSAHKDESKLPLSQLIRVMVAVNKRRTRRHAAVARKLRTAASVNVISNDSAGCRNPNNTIALDCAIVNQYRRL